jgi:predicted RNA-binding protein
MCEANAYYDRNGEEELILESVDVVEPDEEGRFRLVNLFGEQKIIRGKLKSMNLVDHKILFSKS